MLTDRGRALLALGGLTYLAAWAFGSTPLYPVAVGLVLAVGLAALWVRMLRRPMRLNRSLWGGDHLAGDDIRMEVELESDAIQLPGALVMREELERLGVFEGALARYHGSFVGRYTLRAVPRGRYAILKSQIVIEDPFGLERTEVDVWRGDALLVYPRLVEVDRLFSDAGGRTPGGRRLLLHRTTGFELHSVRAYEQGESLRRVHWPSTARRGELMVKELEDAPRDETAVLLDGDGAGVVGVAPDSTFELAVRAAGSILRANAARGRRRALILSSRARLYQPVQSLDADWSRALEVLAAVEPDGNLPIASVLADEAGPASRALELTVVTSQLTPRLVDRLLQRQVAHHGASLVYVDPATFVEDGARTAEVDAQLLRLDRAGAPVLVLRRGDDLAGRLRGVGEGASAAEVAIAAAGGAHA